MAGSLTRQRVRSVDALYIARCDGAGSAVRIHSTPRLRGCLAEFLQYRAHRRLAHGPQSAGFEATTAVRFAHGGAQ
jgi:hypothetical protein